MPYLISRLIWALSSHSVQPGSCVAKDSHRDTCQSCQEHASPVLLVLCLARTIHCTTLSSLCASDSERNLREGKQDPRSGLPSTLCACKFPIHVYIFSYSPIIHGILFLVDERSRSMSNHGRLPCTLQKLPRSMESCSDTTLALRSRWESLGRPSASPLFQEMNMVDDCSADDGCLS